MSGLMPAGVRHASLGLNAPKIPALTGIRGIAAVWVVLLHLSAVASVGHINHLNNIPIIRSGHLAVDMFFILSGFVLALTYSKSFQNFNWVSVRDFWIGRAFRILPLHWLALSLCLSLYIVFGDDLVMTQRHDAISFAASIFLVQNWLFMPKVWNLPAWSLSAEWLAYIGLPIIIVSVARIGSLLQSVLAVLALWLLLGCACLAAGDISLDHIRSLGLVRCLVEFSIGVIMYRIWEINLMHIKCGNTLFFCGMVILAIAMTSSVLDLLAVPAFSLIVLAAGSGASYTQRLIGNRFAIRLGEISFSAYLLHWLMVEMAAYVIVTLNVKGLGAIFVLSFAFSSVWPIAWLTWRYVELPSQKYGKKVLHRVRKSDAPSLLDVSLTELARSMRN